MTASALVASLQRIAQVQAHLSGPLSAALAILAVGAAFLRWLWPVTQHLTTIVHEGAHATMSSALGRKVGGITVTPKAQGVTKFAPGGLTGTAAVWMVGYLGPSLFGVGAAEMIRSGYIVAVLWIGLAGLLAIMTMLRTSFGVLSAIAAFVLLFMVTGFASVGVQVITAYAITWFLLISSVKMIRVDGKANGDAKQLRGKTRIPHGFWWWFWQAGSVVALVFGGILLL
jgi:hypothetical protein